LKDSRKNSFLKIQWIFGMYMTANELVEESPFGIIILNKWVSRIVFLRKLIRN